jgi:hypothetical protein
MDNQNNNPTNSDMNNVNNNLTNNQGLESLETDLNVNPNPSVNLNAPTFETIPENNLNTQPTPPIETLDSEPVVPQTEPQINQPFMQQDNFGSVPEPPSFDDASSKKSKKTNKLLLIILVVVLICGIGYGIYYYLSLGKESATVSNISTKSLTLELGEELSDDIDDYATISGYDKNSCSVDTDDVSVGKIGEYYFYVICGDNKVQGIIAIDDTTSPVVTLNEVTVLPNATVNAEDFIESCVDASECSYEFADIDMVNNSLKSVGEYDIEINATDEYNNTTSLIAKLIVSNNAPVKYLTCTSKAKTVDDIDATMITTYRFGVDSSNKFYNATRKAEFTFNELQKYNNTVNSYDESVGINGVVGNASYNETLKTITLNSNITLDDFNKDMNVTIADDMNTIKAYLSIFGYTCE